MGAGHDGAARQLARRLGDAGHDAEVHDLLDAAPLRLGSLLRRAYELELRHAPGAYERTYRLWYRLPWLCPVVAWLVCVLTRRRVLRWARRYQAQAVVSTYPLATLAIGRLRQTGRLRIPAINFITDFGVHPLWVHRGIDLHLAVHPRAAAEARARTGCRAIACGPQVSDAFAARRDAERFALRAELGLRDDEAAVLVVAGSWGVGDLAETFQAVADSGRYVPVVVCGRDETSRARLERQAAACGTRAVILGWTDRMPALMAACDALVENAGGLTSFEALRARLPVVSYLPIAGHGRANTTAMADSGVSRAAADRASLYRYLDLLTTPGPERSRQLAAGEGIFSTDGSAIILDALRPGALASLPRAPRWRVAWSSTVRVAASLAAAAALTWGGLTTGVGVATAWGAGVAHPVAGIGPVAYVAVRLDAAELADPAVDRAVQALGATVVLDRATAYSDPAEVRRLANAGVDIENAGRGAWFTPLGRPVQPEPWTRASGDVAAGRSLSALIGRPVRFFMPGRSVNAFDLIDAARAHDKVVVPDVTVSPSSSGDLPRPRTRQIWLVDGCGAASGRLLRDLAVLRSELAAAGLTAVPIAALT